MWHFWKFSAKNDGIVCNLGHVMKRVNKNLLPSNNIFKLVTYMIFSFQMTYQNWFSSNLTQTMVSFNFSDNHNFDCVCIARWRNWMMFVIHSANVHRCRWSSLIQSVSGVYKLCTPHSGVNCQLFVSSSPALPQVRYSNRVTSANVN